MKRILLILSLILSCTFAYSQKLWTLEEAVYRARTSSIDAQQSALSIDGAKINLESAQHARYPSLNANTNVGWNFGRTIDPTTNEFNTQTFFSNNLGLNTGMTLYRGGQIKNSIKQAEVLLQAAEKDHEQLINDLALQVANSYVSALFALENERIAQNQLLLSEQQLSQVKKLVQAGSLPANEELQIQAQIARDKQNIIGSKNSYDINILQLKRLLNIDPGEEITIENPGDIPLVLDPNLLTFDEVFAEAIQHRNDIISGEMRMKGSELGLKIAEGGKMPSLTVGGNLGSNYSNLGQTLLGFENATFSFPYTLPDGSDFPLNLEQERALTEKANYFTQLDENLSYGVGFQLSIPIYNNYQVKHSIERAQLDIENTRLNNERTIENLKTLVQQALADSKAAKLQYEASQVGYNSQKAAFDNTEKKYNLGAINTFEYLNAKNQLDASQINLLIAKYDYIFKTVTLDYYMGRPIKLK